MTYRREIGLRIASARNKAKRTQEDVAAACNVDARTVRQWETGGSTPPADALGHLCGLLGCSAEWLVGRPRAESSTLYAIHERTEHLLLTADALDSRFEDWMTQVAMIVDAETSVVDMNEFVRRMNRIRAHRDALSPPTGDQP